MSFPAMDMVVVFKIPNSSTEYKYVYGIDDDSDPPLDIFLDLMIEDINADGVVDEEGGGKAWTKERLSKCEIIGVSTAGGVAKKVLVSQAHLHKARMIGTKFIVTAPSEHA
eukprot:CAMPEP_0198308082 /NCGR_PEP_ID=MMETSP1450-20131203/860_1 /TAXON_ID=753684 ORGANISM="Madagascaria erythrocladiodes, Strain CCMP3234" /NCGR_SAMPLE_ID=MMETSP1450 /ASSEMBLY_ACC=CAM_ASM_001115 /LENGTH=110 /DNA_ID=CAMNT_0044010717 /DNA_START=75 /DNA_END=407 /DNA_ORIENTATION=+